VAPELNFRPGQRADTITQFDNPFSAPSVPLSNHVSENYMRLIVVVRPGVIATVTAIARGMGSAAWWQHRDAILAG
jgi:hypothetical protein